jgi:alkylation response protein AidB-like acyl-CoA dehydrogenase
MRHHTPGNGITDFEFSHAQQEISRADAGMGVTLAVHTSAGTLPILTYGNEEQKARFVPDLAWGRGSGISP